jgi:hypothetical protein
MASKSQHYLYREYRPLLRIFRDLILFLFIFLIVWVLLISTVVFFHFLLDHRINVIEDWIYNNAWSLIPTTTIIGSGIFFKFYLVKFDAPQNYMLRFLNLEELFPKQTLASLVLFLIGLVWFSSDIYVNTDFRLIRYLTGLIGSFLFFLGIIFALQIFKSVNKVQLVSSQLINTVVSFILLSVSFVILFPFTATSYFFLGSSFLILLAMVMTSTSFTRLFYLEIFLLVSFIPHSFGLDFIWGKAFSPFVMNIENAKLEILTLALFLSIYQFVRVHKIDTK